MVLNENSSSVELFFTSVIDQLDLDRLKLPERRVLLTTLLLLFIASLNYNVAPVSAQECGRVLLESPGWTLEGDNGSAEAYQDIEPNSLANADTLQVTLDFHGNQLLTADQSSDASVIIFDQNGGWYTFVLPQADFNGFDGPKKMNIPLGAFKGINETEGIPFSPQKDVGTLHTRIWFGSPFKVTISQVVAIDSTKPECAAVLDSADYTVAGVSTPEVQVVEPTLVPTESTSKEVPTTSQPFEVKSASLMKVTKDRMRNPLSSAEINQLVSEAKQLGANMLSLETPYDSTDDFDAVEQTNEWITAMRAQGLNVWHRHMPLKFEGIYDQPKELRLIGNELPAELQPAAIQISSVPPERLDQYLVQIYEYIITNPDMFQPGDIFTPVPEPDSRRVVGISNCADHMCMFSSLPDFNQWLEDADTIAKEAFKKIGLEDDDITVGMYGFTGFTAAGLGNPDWMKTPNSFLTCAAISSMDGIVAIDHYTDSETMKSDLEYATQVLQEKCPDEFETLAIGEYGNENPEEVAKVFQIFQQMGISTVNYWPLAESPEALVNDGEPTERFEVVQESYQG